MAVNEQYPLGVSVLVRSMNRACLRDALEALDAQTYRHVQILVIDATGGALQELPVEMSLPSRIIPSASPLPRAEAANAGLDSVTTPYALFLDEDDLVDPNHLERLLAALAANEAPAAYAGVRLEQADNHTESKTSDVVDSPWLEGELLVRNTLPIHAVLFRMAAVEQAKARFDSQLTVLEDWDFWLQLASQGAFIHVPGVSATYRLSLGESGLSAERSAERFEHSRATVYRKWLPSADLNVLSQCIGKLNDLSEQQRWDISQLRQDVTALHSESRTVFAQYRQDVEQYQEDAAALNSQIKSLEAYNLTLEEHNLTLEEQRSALEANYSALEANYSALENRYNTLESHFTALERSFQALLNSRSMRLTAPLRWIMSRLRQPTPDAAPTPAAPAAPPPAKSRQKAPVGPIDIIVPVYKGLEETRACLESVWAASPRHAYRLVVINDASPEPEVTEWLREAAKHQPMVLLENEENLGFVGTVNRGMRYAERADVVLLNSDAEVANDWLDRLIAAAYSPGERPVSSVTPFSNNATICSYPRFCEDNELPDGYDLPALDRLFAETNAGETIEIPTAIGFCMYIRRDSLDDVGLFDEEHFGKGYGEENDFCMRTLNAGWRHLHALDVFSWHKGNVSFGDTQPERVKNALAVMDALHPDFHRLVHQFIHQDLAHGFRTKVEIEQLHRSTRPRVLMLNHQRGGGTEQHCKELATHFSHIDWLMLRPDTDHHVVLSRDVQAGCLSLRYHIERDWFALLDMLRYLGVVHLHWHHWLGFPDKLYALAHELSVSQEATLHDFYTICPQITLTDVTGRYCGEQGLAQCHDCLHKQPVEGATSIEAWREFYGQWLTECQRVIVPSHDAATRIKRYYPDLNVVAAGHPDQLNVVYPTPNAIHLREGETLRVAVLGALSPIKGADTLEATAECASEKNAPVTFKLFGYSYRALKSLPNLTSSGIYQQEELPDLINEWAPHVVWFPAQLPETYSYTLSTCLSLGLPVICPNLGAFPERLAHREMSWVLPWDTSPDAFVEHFTTLQNTNTLPDATTSASPGPGASFYLDDYAATLNDLPVRNVPNRLGHQWQLHAQSALLINTGWRHSLVNMLYRLRSHPWLRPLATRLPPGFQRRLKSRILRER
tara:strand:+ start:14493 stop:17876 length:3384 start_codon:yes stop_codon:yes gene_type:complete